MAVVLLFSRFLRQPVVLQRCASKPGDLCFIGQMPILTSSQQQQSHRVNTKLSFTATAVALQLPPLCRKVRNTAVQFC